MPAGRYRRLESVRKHEVSAVFALRRPQVLRRVRGGPALVVTVVDAELIDDPVKAVRSANDGRAVLPQSMGEVKDAVRVDMSSPFTNHSAVRVCPCGMMLRDRRYLWPVSSPAPDQGIVTDWPAAWMTACGAWVVPSTETVKVKLPSEVEATSRLFEAEKLSKLMPKLTVKGFRLPPSTGRASQGRENPAPFARR